MIIFPNTSTTTITMFHSDSFSTFADCTVVGVVGFGGGGVWENWGVCLYLLGLFMSISDKICMLLFKMMIYITDN